jgi:hypothetical protein
MRTAEAGAHAAELEALERQAGLAAPASSVATPSPADTPADGEEADDSAAAPSLADASAATTAPAAASAAPAPELIFGLTRDELLREHAPALGERLWLQLLPPWYWAVVLLLSLMLPSAMIVIALDDAFFRSLNPLNVVDHLQRMGGAYFVLWVFFLLIAGARHAVLNAGADWPAVLRLPLELGIGTYLGLVLCALMGYVLYQFHQESTSTFRSTSTPTAAPAAPRPSRGPARRTRHCGRPTSRTRWNASCSRCWPRAR